MLSIEGSNHVTDGGNGKDGGAAMSTSTLVTERPVQRENLSAPLNASTVRAPEGRPAGPRFRRAMPVLAMFGGLAVMAVAGLVLVRAGDGRRPVDPSAITLSARDVSVVTQVYDPGEDSGWHSHPGIHAVSVIAGVLTVYDSQCQARTFEPGRPYVGGQEPHRVANRTDGPVTMAVTYLNPSSPTRSTEHVAAPAGCAAG